MPPAKTASKSTGTPGVKLFITAASLAATLGGWALLSSAEESQPAAQMVVPPTPAPQIETQTLSIKLPPLPTLVPRAIQPQIVTVNNAAPRAAAPAAPAAPAPLTLRAVSAPPQHSGGGAAGAASAPAPVVNTRSSR